MRDATITWEYGEAQNTPVCALARPAANRKKATQNVWNAIQVGKTKESRRNLESQGG